MKKNRFESLPVIPLRDMAPQPGTTLPMFVGRERSKNAVKAALERKSAIILVSQKTISVEKPSPDDLYSVGILGELNQVMEHSDGTIRIVVTSKARGHLSNVRDGEPCFIADFEEMNVESSAGDVKKAAKDMNRSFNTYCKAREDDMLAESRQLLGRLSELQTQITALRAAGDALHKIDDPSTLADLVPSYITMQVSPDKLGDPNTIRMLDNRIKAKQAILAESDPVKRLQLLKKFIEGELKGLK